MPYFDKENIYCSELVYYAFKDGISEEIGVVEGIDDLNLDNMFVKKLIKQRWKNYPQCRGKIDSFEECYSIIIEQELVTPASVANDKRLKTIYSNYSPF